MLSFYLSLLDTEEERSKTTDLYCRYREKLKFKAYEILRNDFDAEETLHMVFMKIIHCLDKIEDVDSHRTEHFLVIITKNTALDMCRKRKRHPVVSTEVIGEISHGTSDILGDFFAVELANKIRELPDIYRDVLQLKAQWELSDKQLAEMLSISPAAARKRLQRAREMLTEKLAEGDNNDAYSRV
jgi:RNA polymerase sigma-70 factor (ECF subfamily)